MNGLDVAKIRKDLNLTQVEFGKLIGVDKRTVINYEQGKVIPKTKVTLLELMLANGLMKSASAINEKREVIVAPINDSLDDDREVLKDYIKTLKDFLVEKTKIAEMYLNENNILKEKIKILESKIEN
ncbi:helix-turn-helix domain-containing protein [Flavobacterium sp. GNP001]